MKNRPWPLIALYAWLFLFAFIPLCMVISASVLTRDSAKLFTLPFTLQNYLSLFDPIIAKIFVRSLFMALTTTAICLLIAYPFSYLLVKSKHQSLLLLLIIIPFWTSSLVRTYSLIAILKFKGVINTLLLSAHLIEKPLALMYTNFSVITGLVYTLFPFMVLPIFSNMERFDFRLIEAGKDLGANRFTLFFKIFVPNTLPGIVSGCLLVLLPAMTLFYIPNILGGARSVLLGNLITNQFLITENWPQGCATSVILTVSLLLILLFYKSRNKELEL